MKSALKILTTLTAAAVGPFSMAQSNQYFVGGLGYMGSTEADFENDASNSLRVSELSAGFSFIQLSDGGETFIVTLEASRYHYDFGQTMPWEDVNEVSTFLYYEKRLSGRWSVTSLGFVRSGYATDADFEDGITWGLGLGGKYHFSKDLNVTLGLLYVTRLEDDPIVFPLIGFEWEVSDRLSVEGNLGLQVKYDLFGDDTSILVLGFDYNLNDFRLADNAIGETEATVRPEGFGIGLSYEHKVTDSLSLQAKVSVFGEQEYETYADERRISSFKVEEALYYGVGLKYNF